MGPSYTATSKVMDNNIETSNLKKGDTMKKNTRKLFNRRIVRFLALLIATCAMVTLPFQPLRTSNAVEAGCFVSTNSQCDLVSSIEVSWVDVDQIDNSFIYSVHFVQADNTLWGNGICGPGGVEPLSVTPCGSGTSNSKRTFTLRIPWCQLDLSAPYTVSYRISAYVGDLNTPKKWVGSITIIRNQFIFLGPPNVYPC